RRGARPQVLHRHRRRHDGAEGAGRRVDHVHRAGHRPDHRREHRVTTEEYRYHLVAALRTYRVPAARIGEAVAEVESHLADTGEDPVDAFGEPADYARALSLDTEPRIDWAMFAVAV